MSKIGIVGYGEVGRALETIYRNKAFNLKIKDKEDNLKFDGKIKILNICFPYTETFLDSVVSYININNPTLTIIHSTVLPGTTKKIQSLIGKKFVVHSPVRGNHPCLYESLIKFEKYVGSDTEEGLFLSLRHLASLGISVNHMKNSFSTELAKILCTSYYGLCIAWHQRVSELCSEHSVDFQEVMTDWNMTYNKGYKELGIESVMRPVLYPPGDRIGGHCVIPNAELLKEVLDSPLLDEILKFKG